MEERDVLDALLVLLVAILTYFETFGFVDPRAIAEELIAIATSIDVRVYLVIAGIFGTAFVGYLTIYAPKKDASRYHR